MDNDVVTCTRAVITAATVPPGLVEPGMQLCGVVATYCVPVLAMVLAPRGGLPLTGDLTTVTGSMLLRSRAWSTLTMATEVVTFAACGPFL